MINIICANSYWLAYYATHLSRHTHKHTHQSVTPQNGKTKKSPLEKSMYTTQNVR